MFIIGVIKFFNNIKQIKGLFEWNKIEKLQIKIVFMNNW